METLTVLDDVMKEYYLEAVEAQIYQNTDLLGEIEKTKEGIQGGKSIYAALQVAYNERGIGARGENGTLPTAGENDYDHFHAYIKYLYATMSLTGQALKMAKSPNTLINELTRATEGTLNAFKFDVNRQVWGKGDGIMAIGGTLSTRTIPVDKVHNFRPGMFIDSFTSAGAAGITGGDHYITNVDYINGTITVNDATGYTAGDYICRAGNVTVTTLATTEIMGLTGIIDNATGTFQGIDNTNKSWWKSIIHTDSGNRALSIGLLERVIDQCNDLNGEIPPIIYASPGCRRAYAHMLWVKNMPQEIILTTSGYGKGISYDFNGTKIPIISSKGCPANSFVSPNTKYIKLFEAMPMAWDKLGGGLLKPRETSDSVWGRLSWYVNLATTNRQMHWALKAITEA